MSILMQTASALVSRRLMFRLTDKEMKALKPGVPNCDQIVFGCEHCSAQCGQTANAQLKKIIDEIEDMANDGEFLSDILKALKLEIEKRGLL